MPKQSSNKKHLKHSPKSPTDVEQKKPYLKPKKMGSEIDDIFAGKKNKGLQKDNKAHTEKPMKVLASNDVNPHDGLLRVVKSGKRKSSRENEPVKKSTSTRSRKKTADGLTVYTEEELGFGKSDAGGTRLCPFDCDCCF